LANSLDGIEHPNRLLRKLYESRRGGRKKKRYNEVVSEAVEFYQQKKKASPHLSDITIVSSFLKEKTETESKNVEYVNKKYKTIITQMLEKRGITKSSADFQSIFQGVCEDIEYDLNEWESRYKHLCAETLARKVSEQLGKRKIS
jgi:hypothetical protein